jgi:hypothetical protein
MGQALPTKSSSDGDSSDIEVTTRRLAFAIDRGHSSGAVTQSLCCQVFQQPLPYA